MKKYLIASFLFVFLIAGPALAQDNSVRIAEIQAKIAELKVQLDQLLAQQQRPVGECHQFLKDFGGKNKVRGSHEDMIYLRRGLINDGLDNGSLLNLDAEIVEGDIISPVFGENHLNLIKKFQAKYGVPSTGFVGPLTRAKLNSLYGCKNLAISITPKVISPITKGSGPSADGPVTPYYQLPLRVNGFSAGPVTWSIVSGALPSPLTLGRDPYKQSKACIPGTHCYTTDEITHYALISGHSDKLTPGVYDFVIKATNGSQTATQAYSLTVLDSNVQL